MTVATAEVPQALPPPIIIANVGFMTPESVLYDPDEDVYFVSNIHGPPTAADLNGFISKVSPTGELISLKFIDGAKPGSWLNAPKGMALRGDTLYVADITFVRMFDRKTGEPKGKIGVGGATFVNDISVAPNGTIYVSDTGWRAGSVGLEGSGTDAIFSIDPKSVAATELIKDTKLGNPNGIYADNDGVWVASSVGTFYRLDLTGKVTQAQQLPSKGLDGVVALNDGSFLVSSWEAKSIFKGKPGETFEPLLTGITSPADIGYDTKRHRVLVPSFTQNEVRIQDIEGRANQPDIAPSAAPPVSVTETSPTASAPTTPVKTDQSSPAPTASSAAARPNVPPSTDKAPASG